MREVCFLIGRDNAIIYADAGDSSVALPDSRARWEAIWRYRAELEIIAHSHPVGPAAFSAEDRSTMEALDSALGRHARYSVVAPRVTIACVGDVVTTLAPEPWWAGLLRLASGMRTHRAALTVFGALSITKLTTIRAGTEVHPTTNSKED